MSNSASATSGNYRRRAGKAYRKKKRGNFKAQKYGKKGASVVAGFADPTGFGISGRVTAGVSLGKTIKKVAAMRTAADEFKCSCTDAACEDVLVYAVWQKEKKAVDKAVKVASIPLLTACGTSIYRVGRNLYKRYKDELSVKRESMAEDLFDGCLDECPLGQRLVEILLGNHYVGDIQDDGVAFDGWMEIIMGKLASQ